ncbi:MAG: hypothetical protein AAFN77_01735 [Planctomycetota bacterium]
MKDPTSNHELSEDAVSNNSGLPNDEAEPNDRPQQRMMESVEFVGGWLWFHHKIVIGLGLILAVAVWIFVSTRTDEKSESERPATPIAVDERPEIEINVSSASESEANSKSRDRDLAQSKFQELLENGTKMELLEYSLNFMEAWKRAGPTRAVILLSDRLRVIKRLMTMDLTKTEQTFTLTSYIETVTSLDWYNTEDNLGLQQTREALLEVERLYANHNNEAVAAKANLAFVIIPGADFLSSYDLAELLTLMDRLDKRQDKIFRDVKSTSQLAEIILKIQRSEKYQAETKLLAIDVLNRIQAQGSEPFARLARDFREEIYFGDLELSTLPGRIPIDDLETQQDVQMLFDGLETAPDVQIGFYSTAAACVRVYVQVGNWDVAKQLNQRLRVIAGKNSQVEVQQKVLKFVDQLDQEIATAKKEDSEK